MIKKLLFKVTVGVFTFDILKKNFLGFTKSISKIQGLQMCKEVIILSQLMES